MLKTSKYIFGTVVSLSLMVITYSIVTKAESQNNWLKKATGNYQSFIWNAGTLTRGTTEFNLVARNELIGSYTMREKHSTVSGALSECQSIKIGLISCRWNDKYGTGNLTIVFSKDFSNFNGYWNLENSQQKFPWRGSRL
ncbi:hypothetical protein Sta7437_4476 [Stanieria cyanosphaera PCC 7437]|uniref:Uncharacterized protein n=1 Tax=Stanieria cyanosphaera (strain ATCC 29371 / PCC 7437) TaxID=111780 RepID=K9XZB5_STAC7|nr:hypothetical protein [Stanieria cyanosphaera]AFZ37940.1 hypothetical protein Sta7437_4476 [Stanieria cyanosphaera PCC 7437]